MKLMKHFFAEMLPKIQELKHSGKHVFDFGAGAPDLAPPHSVRAKLAELSLHNDLHSYSGYNGISEYRSAVADYYALNFSSEISSDKHVLPVIGSKEAIVHFCNGFLNEGDKVLVPDPGYLTYAAAVNDVNAIPVPYSLSEKNGFQPDINQVTELIKSQQPKLLILNTHQMPTGVMIERSVLDSLVRVCEEFDIVMLNDNPYGRLGYAECKSVLEFSTNHTNKLELLSHSKMHNMAGWRIGAVIGDEKLINIIRKRKNLYDSGMSKVVQLAAAHALTLPKEWYLDLANTYQERAIAGVQLLNQLNCKVVDYQGGMFLWAKCPMDNGAEFCAQLLEKLNIFLVPGSVFGTSNQNFIRLSLTQDVSEIQTCQTLLTQHKELV